jgi:hypothetical protein
MSHHHRPATLRTALNKIHGRFSMLSLQELAYKLLSRLKQSGQALRRLFRTHMHIQPHVQEGQPSYSFRATAALAEPLTAEALETLQQDQKPCSMQNFANGAWSNRSRVSGRSQIYVAPYRMTCMP